MSQGDIEFILDKNVITVDRNGMVNWAELTEYNDYKISEVRRLARAKRLYLIDNTLLITVFPPEVFALFKNVYVLTYIPEGSTFLPYCDIFGLDYSIATITKKEDVYSLTDCEVGYDNDYRLNFSELVQICDEKKLQTKKRLSINWYTKASCDDVQDIATKVGSYYNTYVKKMCGKKPKVRDIMWTCPKDEQDRIAGKGFTRAKPTAEEKEKYNSIGKLDDYIKSLECFVPSNARATNMYRNRWALAYCLDININPYVEKFFANFDDDRAASGKAPVRLNKDAYSVSGLVQWICRSRVRDGLPVTLYLPSKRMQDLLKKWETDGLSCAS